MPDTGITGVDSHAHVFERGLPLASQPRHAPDYDALASEYLGHLDRCGVSHGVLVQPSFLGTDNRYLLGALRQCPQRLRGVVVVEPSAGNADLEALARDGVCGIRLNLIGLALPDVAGVEWQDLFARVRALDWHVEVHCPSHDLARVGQAVLDTGCKLVVDHFGRPEVTQGAADDGFGWLLRAADCGRAWVKLAAAYRSWPDQSGKAACDAAQALLHAFGAERLVWGSDWPHTQYRESVDYESAQAALSAWVPRAADRRQILVETPASLFQFLC